MCYVWEGKIEKCEHCSATDFQNVLRSIYHIEPARPTHQLIARTAQHSLNQGHPQPPRHRSSTVENSIDREHDLTHQARPSSSSRLDALINETAQRKRQREDTDQPSSSARHAPINETAQHKRQKLDREQRSKLRYGVRIEDQCQRGRQGPTPDQISSCRQDTRIPGEDQLVQQAQSQGQLTSLTRDAGSDQTAGHGQKEKYRDPPSSSKHRTSTDLTDEEEDRRTGPESSQNHSNVEDMDVLTMGMNKLPPPCWGDERIMLPLGQQRLGYEEYSRYQEQELNDTWGMFGKEREVLAASHTPEPEEPWAPKVEEEILKYEIPLKRKIWAPLVLEGEAHIWNIPDEDETWLQEESEEVDIWTRDKGGMLTSTMLRRVLRVFDLQASLEEDGLERSDESDKFPYPPYPWSTEEEMRLHSDD